MLLVRDFFQKYILYHHKINLKKIILNLNIYTYKQMTSRLKSFFYYDYLLYTPNS